MSNSHDRTRLTRRAAIAGGATALLVGVTTSLKANSPASPTADVSSSATAPAAHSEDFLQALRAILSDAEPVTGPLSLELPDLAENGNVVPYKITVDSPMTDTQYVRRLHLLSTANPQALVATFHLIPANGLATVAGRMRLAKTQDVVALAELSNDTFLITTRKVEVTIGGCGSE